jgi:pyridoxine 5-phosphate synthase
MWLPIFKNFAPKESPYTRPDERHIRYQDARDLKAVVYTEFNIEGIRNIILDLVLECKPEQVTLFPDAIGALTLLRDGIR